MDRKDRYILAEKALTELLALKRKPVGIKFLKTKEDYEKAEAQEPKTGLPYCTAVAKAGEAKNGENRAYKLDVSHNRCAAASTALGMLPVSEYRLSGQMHVDLKVYKNLEVSRSVAHDMVYCGEENYGVLIKPLSQYEDGPDLVIMILQPKWAMRLIQGYAYNYGQLKDVKMAGMCAICQECTSYPLVRNHPNISMLCAGTRCVGQWHEDELAAGVPIEFLGGIIEGIWKTIDPMENNAAKEKLTVRLKEAGLEVPEIDLTHNYYSKAYGIPK